MLLPVSWAVRGRVLLTLAWRLCRREGNEMIQKQPKPRAPWRRETAVVLLVLEIGSSSVQDHRHSGPGISQTALQVLWIQRLQWSSISPCYFNKSSMLDNSIPSGTYPPMGGGQADRAPLGTRVKLAYLLNPLNQFNPYIQPMLFVMVWDL